MNHKKTIVVIGASSKLGQFICQRLAQSHIVIAHYYQHKFSFPSLVQCDITNETATAKMVETIINTYKHIDALFICSGINPQPSAWNEITDETWSKTYQVNVIGPFNCIRQIVPQMKKQKSGTIITISAKAGFQPLDGRAPAYAASKAALNNLIQALAPELLPDIGIYSLAPGVINFSDTIELGKILATIEFFLTGLHPELSGQTVAID